MRPVSSRNRTGVRSVPAKAKKRRAASKIAPGRRRGHAAERGFGQRAERPAGPLMRWFDELRDGDFRMRPFSAATVLLIAGVVLYGLFVGGHVSAAAQGVAGQANRLLALAGFSIQEVTVTGRTHAHADQLLAALGVERGDPVLGFDTEAARQRIERIDWVKSATVTRMLPDTIRIDVIERVPFAIWQRGGTLSIVDRDGLPITDEGIQSFANLPLVVGFGGSRAATDILTLMEQAQPQFLGRVRAFVRVGDRRWNLRLENGVDVKLPETGIEKALADVVTLDLKYKILSRDIESVDLRLPDRVTIALTAEAASGRGDAVAAKISTGMKGSGGAAGRAGAGSARVGGDT